MNYYEQIKGLLISNEIYKRVKDYSKNKSDVETYYNVGKLIIEAQGGETRAKYGDGLIKEYSKRLIVELNDKKYSYRNLMSMRKFYLIFRDRKVNALRSQLSWSHYRQLLVIKDTYEIIYYINLTISNNLGYRELGRRIKNKEYSRIPIETKNKLIDEERTNIKDLIPNPILINNKKNIDIVTEKTLHNLILEDVESFMKELGNSFSFIVEYISQVQKYMNYIDKNIKESINNNTIGILICKRKNRFVIEYCSDDRIAVREYELV